MKVLIWVSLIIGIGLIGYESFWVGKSTLAWVIIVIAVALILQAAYLLKTR